MERAADSIAADGIGCTSQLENALHSSLMHMGLEMMTTLLTSDIASRDDYEKTADERDGGKHDKTITTIFGDIRIRARSYYHSTRKVHRKTVRSGHYPWDEKMGLLGAWTPAAVSEVLRLASIHNYREAATEFSKSHGFKITKDDVRDIVLKSSIKVKLFNEMANAVRERERAKLVYVLGDGTGISMFKKYLEDVPGKDGKPAKTREVKLGVMFTGHMKKGKPCRDDDSSTYVATVERWEDFGRKLRHEFDRRFQLTPTTVVFLSDGSEWLRSIQRNFFPFAVMILDIFHALEHLKEILKDLGFVEGTKEFKEQFRQWKNAIKAGRIKSVVKKIEEKTNKGNKESVMKKLNYYRDNYDRMNYRKYSDNGWFIGSGFVESGCKCVVQQRLDNSGMHWSVDGSEALLMIRALYKSGRLDEYSNWLVRDLPQVAFDKVA